jgi:hypothetical protein
MGIADRQHELEAAFDRIEETILPSISMMLDTLLDAAMRGKTGIDVEIYAAELRTIALQLEALTQQVEALSPAHVNPHGYRIGSAA